MKKILLYMCMVISLFAIDKAAAITAVKANPALLDTPQAKALMAEKGVNKNEVIQAIKKDTTKTITTDVKIENNVNNTDKEVIKEVNEDNQKQDNKVIKQTNIPNLKPLTYISEKQLVKKIQSIQQKENIVNLKRYGNKFFYNKNRLNTQNLVVPEYYQVNKGDIVIVQIFGGNDKTLTLKIDNNGNIILPILGPIYVAGMSVEKLQNLIQSKLKPTYPNSKILVNVKINSFIQVTLTGFVKAPGIYNLSSLSTVKDLLIVANGFGKLGSMREVYLKRDGKTLKIIDFYKLIKDGDVVDTTLLKNGDIIFIPKAKKLVYLSGSVNIPAIYELKENEKLKDLINYAGGITVNGSKKYIKIRRIKNNDYTEVIFKSLKDNPNLENGDKIYVYKISELNKNLVYVYGNIEKPGSFEIPKDKKLSTLLQKLTYLKDTYYKYGIIETFKGKIISFNLKSPKDIKLNYKDKIYIFNKYDVLPEEFITIKGNIVKNPGRYKYLQNLTLNDAINNVGTKEPIYPIVKIVSFDETMKPILKFVDFTKNPNYKLKPFDEITLFSYYDYDPLKNVTIKGEVNKPGTYLYTKNLTLFRLLKEAGWITENSDTNYIQLIRKQIINNKKVIITKKLTFLDLNVKLLPEDIVVVKKIPLKGTIKNVVINGEVKNPGKYIYVEGMTLKDLIKQAGWITDKADKEYIELVRKIKVNNKQKLITKKLTFNDLNTSLLPEDKITINKIPLKGTIKNVVINGEVKNPGKYIYVEGMTLKDLIKQAGWITDKADTNYIELIRYKIENNKRERIIKKLTFNDLNKTLKPYDEITIKKIPDWNEKKVVVLGGEVKYPGSYTIKKGDRLYDLIKRAGGFTKEAYLYGAVFTRKSVKQMQEKRMEKMIYRLKKKISIIAASAKGAGESSLDAKNLIEVIDNLALQAQKLKPIGRIAINLDKNLEEFKNSKYNIQLQDGDKLYIPTKPDSVIVLGEVLTPTAFVYTDESALKYIHHAGGTTDMADDIYFVVHANGFTEKGEFGFFDKDVDVKNGDAITVPIKIVTATWYGIAKDITSIVYQLAITAASLKTVGAL